MDILSEYIELLSLLKSKLSFHYSSPYSKRNHPQIAVLEDEIRDVEYAITLMTKSNNFSYLEDVDLAIRSKYV